VYFNAAYVAWLNDDPDEWRRGLELVQHIGDRWRKTKNDYALTFSLDMEARLLLSLGQPEDAVERATEAIRIAETLPGSNSLDQVYYTYACALEGAGWGG
jgi:hypothetical protein